MTLAHDARLTACSELVTEGMKDNVTVVVAATDERYWVPGGRRIVVIRTDTWRHHRVGGLPPGTYTVAPAHDLEDGEQFDPELLRSIAARGAHDRRRHDRPRPVLPLSSVCAARAGR